MSIVGHGGARMFGNGNIQVIGNSGSSIISTPSILHLDASGASNFSFSSSNNIQTWKDLAGNYDFTSTGGNGTSGAPYAVWDSSKNAVQFSLNGWSQVGGFPVVPNTSQVAMLRNTSPSTTPIPLTNGGTFYCVLKINNGSACANGPFEFSSNTGLGNLYGYTDAKTMYIDTLATTRSGAITVTPPNGGQNFYNNAIYKVTVTTSNVYTYQFITSTNNVSQTWSGGARGIRYQMQLGYGGSNSFQGYIYEVLLYNTILTSRDQSAIETYLINKWSL